MFQDEDFPPNMSSLSKNWQTLPLHYQSNYIIKLVLWSKIKW